MRRCSGRGGIIIGILLKVDKLIEGVVVCDNKEANLNFFRK
jgi:hypothetical protein